MKIPKEERICVYCRFGSEITGREQMLCKYCGAVASDYSCRKFVYDPLKRIPKRIKLAPLDVEFPTL